MNISINKIVNSMKIYEKRRKEKKSKIIFQAISVYLQSKIDRLKDKPSYTVKASRKPSLILSIVPVAVMLASLIAIILISGSDAISDYSYIILLGSAILAVVIAAINGTLSITTLRQGVKRSATQTLPAVPLLLLIAVISTTWLLSGVVPTLIDIGIRMLNPTLFLVTTCAVCAVVSVLTGSSWTTIATIGVAFIGIGKIMGYSEPWIAGAIISGAYFGDKVSPLSDTTVIASSSCGVDLFMHIRYLMLTAIPAMSIALLCFAGVGIFSDVSSSEQSSDILEALNSTFNIDTSTLVIPLVVAILIALRVKTLYTLAVGTVLGIIGIFVFQPDILSQIEGNSVNTIGGHITSTLRMLWSETTLSTGNETLDAFVSTGGITGMLPTVLLVICAMLFGGAMLGTGMLAVIAESFTRHLTRRESIVGATVGSGLFLNSCTADQYLSIIIGSNMFRDVYKRHGYETKLLSRTLEDSVSVTSVLIPWNSCGVTQSAVLGVATMAYLPCCIFNILSPLMSLFMAWTGYGIRSRRIVDGVVQSS